MDSDNLIRMANQIGAFFNGLPDREAGADGVADHIRKFWEPRMRYALRTRLEEDRAARRDPGLQPIVAQALARHPTLL